MATIKDLVIYGQFLCIDFCNTLGGDYKGQREEYFKSWSDWEEWLYRVGLAPGTKSGKNISLDTIKSHREFIMGVLEKISGGKLLNKQQLERLNEEYTSVNQNLQLKQNDGRLTRGWRHQTNGSSFKIGQIYFSLFDLLMHEDLSRVKKCEGCSWYFYDISKNNSRKWCDMKICGNRKKSKRFYQKKKADK